MRALLALCAAMALSGAALAQRAPHDVTAPEDRCLGKTQALMDRLHAAAKAYDGFALTTYTGEQARAVLAAFNADPPASEFTADTIIVLEDMREAKGTLMVMFLNSGCIGNMLRVPVPRWHEIVSKSIGDGT